MTMTAKMLVRANTFDKGQMLDQELLYMIMDGLVEVGTIMRNGGATVLKARLTEKGKRDAPPQSSGPDSTR
jgi:hypothetical protein